MKIPKNKALRFVLAAVLASVMLSTGCQESDEDQGDNTILSTVDSSAPENPSILINNGDATTDSTQVVLNLSAIDDIGVIAIYLSEDDTVPSAAVAGWISVSAAIEFSGTVSFVLSGGDGEKTVYAWFRDAAGNVSAGASDSIALVSESVETCGVPEKNEYVYNLMQDVYLWYDRMPNVDYTDYASPELLLDALRYEDLDRWSYIAEKAEYDRYFNEGQTIGMGIGYRYDGTYLWIRYVLNDSPADLAGLSRGDRILEINGKTLQEIIDQSIENINLGPDEEDVIVNLVVEDVSGDTENIAVTKSLITIDTVLQS
ncbi:MAG: hypothetical protein GY866_43060, partial [Proteobacteria bacterium]|nr:hypothetical protein [Pseudomonadota bacterium]